MVGRHDEGIDLQRTVLEKQRELGSEIARPHFLAAMGQTMLEARRPEAAVEAVDEGLETVARTGARYYHAELLRLRGECSAALSDARPSPEDLFRQALEIALGQQAKSFELRSAMSLARWLHRTDRAGEARLTLQGVYSWFSEGFDTEDLREARELLAGLG
jgi:predicted ATPase